MLMSKQFYRFPLYAVVLAYIVTQSTHLILGSVVKFKSSDINSNSPSQINCDQPRDVI